MSAGPTGNPFSLTALVEITRDLSSPPGRREGGSKGGFAEDRAKVRLITAANPITRHRRHSEKGK